MADTSKFDPFKPAQPSIPGVPAAASVQPQPEPEPKSAEFPQSSAVSRSIPSGVWVAVGLMIVLGLGGAWIYWSSASTSNAQPVPSANSAAVSVPADAADHAENLPVGPGIIASTKDLAKPWASKRFLFRSDLSSEEVPALVVRLPNGQYWGLSMVEPFGSCKLEYVTDLSVLRTEYDFRANHPMVGDPCTHTVYDLLQYDGGAPDGGLVRGAIVHGAGVRPPLAIEIDVQGNQLRAVRME
ncbi:MAG: hypothetical protein ACRD4X_04090 [Candidatus Acidiferrales bacterium]